MDSPTAKTKPQHLKPRRGIRVVGKIGSFPEKGSSSSPSSSPSSNCSHVSVVKSAVGYAVVAYADQTASRNESYKLDWCYEQAEDAEQIFSKEVKPFLDGVFCGSNACIIAYGACRSGKTQLIQGSEENPGLAPITMSEILSFVNENGGSVSISCYEVNQDHIFDVLGPKEQEVHVLEDAERKIQLKGLSQVPVKSISDFKRIYFQGPTQQKGAQNAANDPRPSRRHRGLIIYVAIADKETNTSRCGRINLIDLAGYKDAKHTINNRPHLIEIARINKSLFALLNVVYALNTNEAYIPYRESKLTRLLQDFMGKASQSVLVTCLNPILCQDTAHVASMASRSSQVVNQHRYDSAKKNKSSVRHVLLGSSSNGRNNTLNSSAKKKGNQNLELTVNKYNAGTPMTKSSNQLAKVGGFQPGASVKETKDASLQGKGRKLLDGLSHVTDTVPDKALVVSANVEASPLEEDPVVLTNKELAPSISITELDVPPSTEDATQSICPTASSGVHDDMVVDRDIVNETEKPSPLLSERIREISNSLKLLSCQPLNISTPASCAKKPDQTDPKTPIVPFNMSLDENVAFENMCTPQDRLRTRSTGLKKSLVQECLAFLNSASKEELKRLKGIGDKRASYIVELRETDAEPFKEVDDLRDLGLSSRQIRELMTSTLGDF